MKQNQFLVKERYVSPCCIEEILHPSTSIMQASVSGGNDSLEGMNNRDTSGWGWDDED